LRHYTDKNFWRFFHGLPDGIKDAAREQYRQLRKDPTHPSLHFKKVQNFYSVRVTKGYRALAVKANDDYIWFWVGTHDMYDRYIR
jgi:hypothetical protein